MTARESDTPKGWLAGVLFDMDGVQVDSEPLHTESFRRLFAECGVPMPAEIENGFRGHDDRAIFRELKGRRCGLPGRIEELIAARTRLFLEVLEEGTIAPMEGLLELFDALDRAAVPFALGSSSVAAIVEGVVRRLGTRGRFAAIVSGSDVARCKPYPDIYLEAARRIGADPRRCVVIEDAKSGIEAAHAAGAKAVLLRDPRYPDATRIRADLAVDFLLALDLPMLDALGDR